MDTSRQELVRSSEVPSKYEISAPTVLNKQKAILALHKAMKGMPGLIIGETHTDDAAREILMDAIGYLREQGIQTIYLEAIRDDYQKEVDLYRKTRNMTPDLKRNLSNKIEVTGKGPHGYEELVNAIIQEGEGGIDIQAADTRHATMWRKSGGDKDKYLNREATMNYFALEAVTRNSKGGPFIILAGDAHLSETTHKNPTGEGFQLVKGLSGLLGVPAISIKTGVKEGEEKRYEFYYHPIT